jgi:hypothetical protein
LALRRTMLLPAVKDVALGWVGFAKESGGLTTAAAAPAPNNCVNLRREIDRVFIS